MVTLAIMSNRIEKLERMLKTLYDNPVRKFFDEIVIGCTPPLKASRVDLLFRDIGLKGGCAFDVQIKQPKGERRFNYVNGRTQTAEHATGTWLIQADDDFIFGPRTHENYNDALRMIKADPAIGVIELKSFLGLPRTGQNLFLVEKFSISTSMGLLSRRKPAVQAWQTILGNGSFYGVGDETCWWLEMFLNGGELYSYFGCRMRKDGTKKVVREHINANYDYTIAEDSGYIRYIKGRTGVDWMFGKQFNRRMVLDHLNASKADVSMYDHAKRMASFIKKLEPYVNGRSTIDEELWYSFDQKVADQPWFARHQAACVSPLASRKSYTKVPGQSMGLIRKDTFESLLMREEVGS